MEEAGRATAAREEADASADEPDVLALCSEPGVRSTMPESCEQLVRDPRRSLLSSASISVACANNKQDELQSTKSKYVYESTVLMIFE